MITVRHLSKTFLIPEREPGWKAALGSLVKRHFCPVHAVQDVNFTIEPGEMVGFIGPNGAGKTTTLKMLAGLLYPSHGEVVVAGYTPWERKTAFLRTITLVMGNRGQLNWENTVADSLYVLAEIYNLPPAQYRDALEELVEMLEIKEHLPRLARNLSLGERMKCEIAAALLHRPQVVFLDEPTLGLDVSMQIRLRSFISEYNRTRGATILLTSHYMADVVSLCRRVLLIQNGSLLFDGELKHLAEKMAPFKQVRLEHGELIFERLKGLLPQFGEDITILEQSSDRTILRVRRNQASAVIARLVQEMPAVDLSVEDPPIEAVIDQVYRQGVER